MAGRLAAARSLRSRASFSRASLAAASLAAASFAAASLAAASLAARSAASLAACSLASLAARSAASLPAASLRGALLGGLLARLPGPLGLVLGGRLPLQLLAHLVRGAVGRLARDALRRQLIAQRRHRPLGGGEALAQLASLLAALLGPHLCELLAGLLGRALGRLARTPLLRQPLAGLLGRLLGRLAGLPRPRQLLAPDPSRDIRGAIGTLRLALPRLPCADAVCPVGDHGRGRHDDEHAHRHRRPLHPSPQRAGARRRTLLLVGLDGFAGRALPGIVGAEIPDMPFRIAARVAAAALLLDVEHDLGARRLGPLAVRRRILDEQVADLGLGPARVGRLRHQPVEGRIASRPAPA